MVTVEEVPLEQALAETLAFNKGKWATLLDAALQSQRAVRITDRDRKAALGKINFLYKLLRSERYAGKLQLRRKDNVFYIIPVA